MANFFKETIKVFGILPICNLNEERAFYIGSFCFPLCVRCSAIILTIFLTVIIKTLLKPNIKKPFILLWIVFIIPCLIDGFTQYFFNIESTNLKRLVFGILSGYGIGSLIYLLFNFLDKKNFKKTNKKQ